MFAKHQLSSCLLLIWQESLTLMKFLQPLTTYSTVIYFELSGMSLSDIFSPVLVFTWSKLDLRNTSLIPHASLGIVVLSELLAQDPFR